MPGDARHRSMVSWWQVAAHSMVQDAGGRVFRQWKRPAVLVPFLLVCLEVHDAGRCAVSAVGLLSESPTTIEVQDDGLVMPARCESLIAIRSRDSRSVVRRHRDVQLRGMGSYVRSGCSPPTLGESGAIAATRFPHRFVLLDSCTSPPRPRHKERVNAHHELAILQLPSSCFPFMSSGYQASSSLFLCPFTIWVFLITGISFVFLCSYHHPSKARVLGVVTGLPSLVRTRLRGRSRAFLKDR